MALKRQCTGRQAGNRQEQQLRASLDGSRQEQKRQPSIAQRQAAGEKLRQEGPAPAAAERAAGEARQHEQAGQLGVVLGPAAGSSKAAGRKRKQREIEGCETQPQPTAASTGEMPDIVLGTGLSSGGKVEQRGLAGAAAQGLQYEQRAAGKVSRREAVPHAMPGLEQELLAAAVARVVAAEGDALDVDGSPSKKTVRFSLKRNLVNVIGQPPKPADVRTPPTSKPKGPALKRRSLLSGPASAPERMLTRAGKDRAERVRSMLEEAALASDNHTLGWAAPPAASASQAKAQCGLAVSSKTKRKRRSSLPAPGSFVRPRATEFF